MADSRTKKEQYISNLRSALSGVSPQNDVGGGGTGTEEPDYYEQLKNESYKTMLSKEVQAYNAQEQARKYTGAGLFANGYGTQGVSESASLGIGNTYTKALRDAQNEYDQSVLAIDQQAREEGNSDFESLATLLGSSSSTSQLDSILTEYGYLKDGQWTDEFNKLDKRTQNQIKSLYSLYSSEFDNQEWLSNMTINGVGYKDSGTAIQNIATADGSLGKVSNELRMIFGDSYLSEVENKIKNGGNYVVKLINVSNNNQFVYMIYRNGTWYQTTANVYNGADYKDTIKGAK